MARDGIFAHGAVIVPDFVTPAEEERILLRIAQAPWMTELRRRVQHYGYRYENVAVDLMLRSPRNPARCLQRAKMTAT